MGEANREREWEKNVFLHESLVSVVRARLRGRVPRGRRSRSRCLPQLVKIRATERIVRGRRRQNGRRLLAAARELGLRAWAAAFCSAWARRRRSRRDECVPRVGCGSWRTSGVNARWKTRADPRDAARCIDRHPTSAAGAFAAAAACGGSGTHSTSSRRACRLPRWFLIRRTVSKPNRSRVLQTARAMIAECDGSVVRGLYRGFGMKLPGRSVPASAVAFFAYEESRRWLG